LAVCARVFTGMELVITCKLLPHQAFKNYTVKEDFRL